MCENKILAILIAIIVMGMVSIGSAQIMKQVTQDCFAFATTDELNTFDKYLGEQDLQAAQNYVDAAILTGQGVEMHKGDQVIFESATGFLWLTSQVRYPGELQDWYVDSQYLQDA